jgi:hypothetical protein
MRSVPSRMRRVSCGVWFAVLCLLRARRMIPSHGKHDESGTQCGSSGDPYLDVGHLHGIIGRSRRRLLHLTPEQKPAISFSDRRKDSEGNHTHLNPMLVVSILSHERRLCESSNSNGPAWDSDRRETGSRDSERCDKVSREGHCWFWYS